MEKGFAGDRITDVAVIGSGGSGLSAALASACSGARTLVLEVAPGIGGSTLFSGGLAWFPNNHLMTRFGIADSCQDVLDYMQACMPERKDRKRWEAFVDAAPEAVRFLEDKTPLRFSMTPAPDSFAEKKGGRDRGRNLEPCPLRPAVLGEWQNQLITSPHPGHPVTLGEAFHFVMKSTGIWSKLRQTAGLGPKVLWRRLTGRQTMGAALITGLLKGCRDAGVDVLCNAQGKELIIRNGSVIGLQALIGGQNVNIHAKRGVVLATGGFEWNPELVYQYLPGPLEYPLTTPFARGDGLIMARDAGAELAFMNEVMLWTAAMTPNRASYQGKRVGILVNPIINNPHAIMVNRQGRRFVNEPSHNAPQAYHEWNEQTQSHPNLPAWSVFDTQFREAFSEESLGLKPGKPDPEWLIKDESLAGLAQKAGIDPEGLKQTVERFNRFCRQGKDLDFNRGEYCYDWHFVPNIKGNPNLGSLEKPPYYAVRLYPSTVGTKGGPMTNENWQVIDRQGRTIKGLYAAGTCAAAIIGPLTISSSSAVGLILTQGYLAGCHAAGRLDV